MAHNFRKHLTEPPAARGPYFVSKAGRPGNTGLSPDSPLPSVQICTDSVYKEDRGDVFGIGSNTYSDGSGLLIVGAGLYTGEVLTGVPHRLVADGQVTWNVNGRLLLGTKDDYLLYNGGSVPDVKGITFLFVDTLRAGYSSGGFANPRAAWYADCSFSFTSNGRPNVIWGGAQFTNCLLQRPNGAGLSFAGCLVRAGQLTGVTNFSQSYADADTRLELSAVSALNTANVQGLLRVAGDAYGYTDLATFKQNYNLLGRKDLISAPPGFNNEFAEDFSLLGSSVHNTLGIGPARLRQASSIFLVGPVGDVDATSGHYYLDAATGLHIPIVWTDGNIVCTQQGGQNRLKVREAPGGALFGQYRTGFHVLGDTPQQVEYINFLGGNNSDTDFPTDESLFNPNSPEPNNSNVPNARNYVSGHAGRNPNRWELDVWFGNKDNPNLADPNDFTNGSTPISVEWNGPALYNPLTLIGNGDPTFDARATGGNAPRKIQAKYLVYQVTLRNDNYSR